MATEPYNPLDKINLARSIEAEILKRDCEPLALTDDVVGAGVYAIYYRGSFVPYAALAEANRESCHVPIYVGKAIPKGGRKGGIAAGSMAASTALSLRLRKHASTVRSTSTLNIDDFSFRYLVLDDIWIPLGENILIETFKPLWNVAVEGFGINDPGAGRSAQKRSPWDVLHPGRGYADKLTGGGPDAVAVVGRIEDHFAGRPLRSLPRALAATAEDAKEEDRGEV
ncbi:MAG: Eco29kI family restriction endonuclease [Bosea sp. (in: a-proteobacteria)]